MLEQCLLSGSIMMIEKKSDCVSLHKNTMIQPFVWQNSLDPFCSFIVYTRHNEEHSADPLAGCKGRAFG